MANDSTVILMDAGRIQRSLKRIAYQISEDNRNTKELVILGINERGYAVAGLLQQYLTKLSGQEIACHRVQIEDGRTDIGDLSLENKYVLLVDDVIFSGTTMFRALNMISEKSTPEEVHTATLIDRGHRKFPVFAQFVGMELPTKLDEHVRVVLEDNKPGRVLLNQSAH